MAHPYTLRVRAGRPRTAPKTPHSPLTGRRFGHLVVLDFIECRDGKAWWSCQCDCKGPGSQIIVRSDKLLGGQTRACKCRMGYKTPGVVARVAPPAQVAPVARVAPPVRILTARPGIASATAGKAHPDAPTGHRRYSADELAAAELLSARQMVGFRFKWSEIAAYLAISRGGECTVALAKQLTAA